MLYYYYFIIFYYYYAILYYIILYYIIKLYNIITLYYGLPISTCGIQHAQQIIFFFDGEVNYQRSRGDSAGIRLKIAIRVFIVFYKIRNLIKIHKQITKYLKNIK